MIRQIAVIGSGVMGSGIAQSFAAKGYTVFVNDVKEEFLNRAAETIGSQLDFLIKMGEVTSGEKTETQSKIHLTTDLAHAVSNADWIIEAIPEVIELKWNLYEQLKSLKKDEAIVSSNTSTFPLSRLTERTDFEGEFLITHFFNPAHLVPLVELVKKSDADEQMIQDIVNTLKNIGKKPVLLKKEINGFIANRLQTALMREAFSLIDQGVADAEAIDEAVTSGIGYRWALIGPTRIADLGGLDTWKRVFDNIAPELDKSTGAPDLINQKVAGNLLGIKTGKGLYDYQDDQAKTIINNRDEAFIRLARIKNKVGQSA